MNNTALRIFVFRSLKSHEIDDVNSLKSKVAVITTDLKYAHGLEIEVDLVENIAQQENRAKEYVQNLGHLTSISGRSIIDCTTFEGVVLWHPVRFGVYYKFKNALIQSCIVDEYCKEDLKLVRVYTDDQNLQKMCLGADIRCVKATSKKVKTISPLKFISLFFLRSIIGLIRNGFPDKGKRIVLNTVSPLVSIVDIKNGKMSKGIAHLDYFLQLIKSNNDFAVVTSMKFIGVKDGLFPFEEICFSRYPKRNIFHFESFVLMSLLSLSSIKKLMSFWKGLNVTVDVKESSVNQVLFDDFRIRKVQFFYAAILTLGGFRLMKKMSPKTIGGDNEHSFIRRSILGAAKENGIPTFAIQHGDIHHNVFNYQFVKEDPLQKLLPDMTAVWSERTKKSLVDISGYKPESISVVGQIRTDIIPFLIKGIQSKKEQRVFTVLFASQPFSNQELRKRMYCDFNRAAQELQNFNFIHKPHPGETEWSFFDELDSELEFNIERTNADLYSTLGGVDAIVTGYSTVAIEALYFNDDVIVLDYYKEDLANYIKDQVALRAVNYQELVQAIRRLANGEELLDQNIRDAYIKERVCMIDGKTSMRLKEAIEAL